MKTLRIDEKWSIAYDPTSNDRPVHWLRHGIFNCPFQESNAVTAMFCALLAAQEVKTANPVELPEEDGTILVRFQMAVCTCQKCGVETPFAMKVLHAVGDYCHACAPLVSMMAHANAERQIREGMAAGIVTLPTKDYDPKAP